MGDDIAIDLRCFNISDIDDMKNRIFGFESFRLDHPNLKFLIVTIDQRYMILQFANRGELDAVPERFLGLTMAIAK